MITTDWRHGLAALRYMRKRVWRCGRSCERIYPVVHATKADRRCILVALKDTVPTSQIVYGNDIPVKKYSLTNRGQEEHTGFSPEDWKAIDRENADRPFPRLKA